VLPRIKIFNTPTLKKSLGKLNTRCHQNLSGNLITMTDICNWYLDATPSKNYLFQYLLPWRAVFLCPSPHPYPSIHPEKHSLEVSSYWDLHLKLFKTSGPSKFTCSIKNIDDVRNITKSMESFKVGNFFALSFLRPFFGLQARCRETTSLNKPLHTVFCLIRYSLKILSGLLFIFICVNMGHSHF